MEQGINGKLLEKVATMIDQKEYAPFYHTYVSKVPNGDFTTSFVQTNKQTQAFFEQHAALDGNYRYEEGKWTIKEVLMHLIDTEKIMAFRALCIARGDQTKLPGFDQNQYAETVDVSSRTIKDLVEEFILTRQLTMATFKHFTDKELKRIGTASNSPVSVRALAHIIIGHELHHMGVLAERYV